MATANKRPRGHISTGGRPPRTATLRAAAERLRQTRGDAREVGVSLAISFLLTYGTFQGNAASDNDED